MPVLFGREYAAPFGIAPMGGSAAVAYDAGNVMAEATRQRGIPFVLSGNSITPMEEVARHCPGAWFAAYQSPNPDAIEGMVNRVAAAGFSTFVLTADVPVGSNREDDARAGFSQPIRLNAKLVRDGIMHPGWLVSTAARTLLKRGVPHIDNLEYTGGPGLFSRAVARIASHTRLSWDHVRLIRRLWKGPFVVKGILSRADARAGRTRHASRSGKSCRLIAGLAPAGAVRLRRPPKRRFAHCMEPTHRCGGALAGFGV